MQQLCMQRICLSCANKLCNHNKTQRRMSNFHDHSILFFLKTVQERSSLLSWSKACLSESHSQSTVEGRLFLLLHYLSVGELIRVLGKIRVNYSSAFVCFRFPLLIDRRNSVFCAFFTKMLDVLFLLRKTILINT